MSLPRASKDRSLRQEIEASKRAVAALIPPAAPMGLLTEGQPSFDTEHDIAFDIDFTIERPKDAVG